MNSDSPILTPNTNIVLVGMAGAGKSTTGKKLAKRLQRKFIDTDSLIEASYGNSLQNILDENGYMALRDIEQQTLLTIHEQNCVLATGGSAVYSHLGMAHLKKSSIIVFLNITLATVIKRIGDFSKRGLAKAPDQSLESLFEERQNLYYGIADIVINTDSLDANEVVVEVLHKVLSASH